MTAHEHIARAIDTAPLNRGRVGAEWLASPGNIPIYRANGDVTLFDDDEGDGVYQMHVLYQSQGKAAIAEAKGAIRILFELHRGNTIFVMVPYFRRDVKMLARWCGLKFVGIRTTAFGACELYVLSKTTWKLAR